MRFKVFSISGIVGIALFLLPLSVLAWPVFKTSYDAAEKAIKARKQEQAERDHRKRVKYVQGLPPGVVPKVFPNVRDLPD